MQIIEFSGADWIKTVILLIKREKIRDVIIQLGSAWRTTGLNEEQIKMKNAVSKRLYYGGIGKNI